MERQLIHSLLGQSEVLTASGVALYLSGHTTFGVVLLCLGVIGSFTRFGINVSIVQRQTEELSTSESESNEIDEIKTILSEIKRSIK